MQPDGIHLNRARVAQLRDELSLAVTSLNLLLAAWEDTEPPPEPEPISKPQIRAFHAMCRRLDDWLGIPDGSSKARVKAEYDKASTLDFTHDEAHEMLDTLDREMEQHGIARDI